MKKTLALIAAAVALGGFWQLKARMDRNTQAMQQLQSVEDARILKLETELAKERKRNDGSLKSQQDIVNRLKQQLLSEKNSLDSVQQRYETARNLSQSQDWGATIEVQLRKQRDLIAEAEAQLKSLKAQSGEIGNQSKIAQNQERLGEKLQRAELEARIRAQALLVQDSETKLKELKNDRLNFDARAGIQPLQVQLRDQKLQLQGLKDLRPQIGLQTNSNLGGIQAEVQQEQTGLRESQELLEGRIRQEKTVYSDLQRQLNEAKQDRGSRKSEMDKLQADFQKQRDKVNALKPQLTEQEARLRE